MCIYTGKDSGWSNKENDANRLKDKTNKAQLFIAGGLALVLYASSVIINTSFIFAAIGLLSLIGLVTSILVAGEELGVQNTFVKQVCGAVSNGGCAKVLKSTYARGFAGVTAGDLAIIYFATQLIAVFCSAFYPAILNAMILFSLAGILVAGWSIYTQAVLVKQWCALCLGIVAILLLQSLISLYAVITLGLEGLFGSNALLLFVGIGLLLGLAQLPIKALLKTNYMNGQKLAELKKWKMDAGLFLSQWENEQTVDTTIWENDLVIGNPNAPIKITVACNPYCGPCAKAHEQLDKMLEKHDGEICIVVRFLCDPNDESDRRTIVVKSILQIAKSSGGQKQIKQAISEWFREMNYSHWQKKWLPVLGNDVQAELENHKLWVSESTIRATPSFFINGKKVPGRYVLTDFEKLVPQLLEALAIEVTKDSEI
ncbi:MAG: thioredoxin domain-containing protein [Ferruginibacter sp.]|nr:thioredoxin domain-containing protein [Ferruginibacter sp.]